MGKGKITLGVVAGVAVIAAISANAGGGGKDDTGSDASGSGSGGKASAEKTPGAKKADGGQQKKAAFSGDGDFQVGSDVKAGTYRTTGNSDGMCYWERAKDASGNVDSVLANDNVTGTSYVTVKATDKLFKTSGCNDWEAVDTKATGGSPATAMKGDGGMFRVGADVAPGTYRSTGNTDDGCYWERAKSADHSLDSVVANNNVSGTAVVTISASDAYFKTVGCGDWKKTG